MKQASGAAFFPRPRRDRRPPAGGPCAPPGRRRGGAGRAGGRAGHRRASGRGGDRGPAPPPCLEIAAGSRKGEHKYLDIVFFVHAKLRLARELGLDRAGGPLDILDIGSGAGHFALVCRSLGHRVTAIDIPNPVYDAAAPALGVERVMHRLEPGAGLPDLGRRFDLVTAMGVNFCKLFEPGEAGDYWTLDQWRPLLDDLAARATKRPGRVWMRLNCEARAGGPVYNPELMDLAEARGARVDRGRGMIDWGLAD